MGKCLGLWCGNVKVFEGVLFRGSGSWADVEGRRGVAKLEY